MNKQRQTSNGVKRILIFSLAYHPYVGGAEIAIKEITDRLLASEYEFDMITLRFDKRLPALERMGNVNVHRIGFTANNVKVSDRRIPLRCRVSKILFPITAFFKARSLHQRHPYSIIWAMMANQAGFGALLFKYAHPRIPYFLELQDGNSLEQVKSRQPFLRLIWGFYRRIYLKADIIKAISNFIADLAREIGFKGPVEIIPNAVDAAKFSARVSIEEQVELKARFGKKMDDVFLFTASRLVLSRGIEDIIRALKYLPANVKLLIAGIGEDQENLEKIAHDSGVAKRVLFVGHVSHERLPVYYQISDIFVRPSIIEGFGSSFVEAFAAGIPVIATPVGGIPDFLFDPERNPHSPATGLFCEVRNPESIARAVLRYMREPALVAEVVQNAKALAEKKYDWDIIARDMDEKVFNPLMNV
ncbi:MAG: glycosyltransferase family 4 protein [Candidatus Kaiserbacteria bacterium]|nr:glycosyltransferase family 4 protein [Candidatus Kaiserbacteria bacterium]